MRLRTTYRLMAALLALCLTAALLPLPAHAAGNTIQVPSGGDLLAAIAKATDGDTIEITDSAIVIQEIIGDSATDTPWIIDKQVTIQGANNAKARISLNRSGIVLGKNVTFKNIDFSLATSVRNSFMANGYTLELNNVTASNQYSINLFCGGLLKNDYENFTVPASGGNGIIIINGITNLQGGLDTCGSGNIYAGNLCMGNMGGGTSNDGVSSIFDGDASIVINADKNSDLGSIYACGAKQYAPNPDQAGKRTEPDANKYTVTGTVTITGNNRLPDVEGGGSSATNVVYRGDGNPSESTFTGISSLSVETGSLALTVNSQFEDNGNLSVASGAKLDLTKADGRHLNVGNFSGNGGFMFLNQNQTLNITGQVTGTTKVAIGGTNYDNTLSSSSANVGQTYISAPNSTDKIGRAHV